MHRERWLALGVVMLAVVGVVAWQWPVITDQPRPLDRARRARLADDLTAARAQADAIDARYAALIASHDTLVAQRRERCPLTFSPPSVEGVDLAHDDWVSVHEPGAESVSVLATEVRRALSDLDADGLFTSLEADDALATASAEATRAQPDVLLVADQLREDDGRYSLGGTVFLFDATTICGARMVIVNVELELGAEPAEEGAQQGRRRSPEEILHAWARHRAIGPINRGSLVVYAPAAVDHAAE